MTPQRPSSAIANFTTLASGEMLARAVAFIGTAHLTRRLGPDGFGLLEFAIAICTYGAFVVTAGFESIGVREVARRRANASEIAAGGAVVRFVLGVGAASVIGLVVWMMGRPAPFGLVVGLTAMTLLAKAVDFSWVHKGLEHGRIVSGSVVLAQVVYVAVLLATVRSASDVWLAPLAILAGQLAAAMLLAAPLFPTGRIRPNVAEGVAILRQSGPMVLSRLFRALILNFDLVVIGLLLEARFVGLYGAAYRFYGLAWAVAVSLHVAYLPATTRALSRGPSAVSRAVQRALNLSAAIGIPLAVGGSVLAGPLLQTFFGAPFADGAPAFRLLLVSVGLVFLHGALRNVLIAAGRTTADMGIMAAAAGVNVGLDLLLVPPFGLVGAAAATVAAELLVLVLVVRSLRSVGVTAEARGVIRCATAAGVMAVLLVVTGPTLALFYNVALGALVYFFALGLIGGLPADIAVRLRAWARRRRRRAPGF